MDLSNVIASALAANQSVIGAAKLVSLLHSIVPSIRAS